jgi:hypothetical protein
MSGTFRTDRHNNPIAFTTDMAKQAGLIPNVDYERGEPFYSGNSTYHTARLIGNPVALCINVIDKIGFYTQLATQRWAYIGIPDFIWSALTYPNKVRVIEFMYKHEGGVELEKLFH